MIAGAFNPSFFNSGLIYAWPEIFLSLAACAILMLDLLLNDAQRRWTGVLSVPSAAREPSGVIIDLYEVQ